MIRGLLELPEDAEEKRVRYYTFLKCFECGYYFIWVFVLRGVYHLLDRILNIFPLILMRQVFVVPLLWGIVLSTNYALTMLAYYSHKILFAVLLRRLPSRAKPMQT